MIKTKIFKDSKSRVVRVYIDENASDKWLTEMSYDHERDEMWINSHRDCHSMRVPLNWMMI